MVIAQRQQKCDYQKMMKKNRTVNVIIMDSYYKIIRLFGAPIERSYGRGAYTDIDFLKHHSHVQLKCTLGDILLNLFITTSY